MALDFGGSMAYSACAHSPLLVSTKAIGIHLSRFDFPFSAHSNEIFEYNLSGLSQIE